MRGAPVSTRVETLCCSVWRLQRGGGAPAFASSIEMVARGVRVSPAGRLCGLFPGGACVSPYRCVLSYACFLSCWLLGERVHCGGGDGSVVGVVTLVL